MGCKTCRYHDDCRFHEYSTAACSDICNHPDKNEIYLNGVYNTCKLNTKLIEIQEMMNSGK